MSSLTRAESVEIGVWAVAYGRKASRAYEQVRAHVQALRRTHSGDAGYATLQTGKAGGVVEFERGAWPGVPSPAPVVAEAVGKAEALRTYGFFLTVIRRLG